MNNSFHIADLIVKKIRGQITSGELKQLDDWINEKPGNREIYEQAADPKKQLEKMAIYSLFDRDKVWSGLENELFRTKTVQFTPTRLFRIAAAILLPILVAGSTYLIFKRNAPTSLAELDSIIIPGSQKAILILSDGAAISLEGNQAPHDLKEGDARISNENNQLSYSDEKTGRNDREVLFNELRTPRGGGYHLILADGTSVWLNAESSLKYPVTFSDTLREIYLEGEALFEVAHNGEPFVVSSGRMNVSVLGTTFDISAYPDEQEFTTTLVEGSVQVDLVTENNIPLAREILVPDRQAILDLSNSEIKVEEVNASFYTSWMNGKIEFNNDDLYRVIKKLARWYDFDFIFENSEAMQYHFTARLDRSTPISSVLEMLEMTTDVSFVYKDGTIVIQ